MLSTRINSSDQMPFGPHFQIILFKTTNVLIPGDERSRMNPGHGYLEHTETYHTNEIYATQDESKWRADIDRLVKEKPQRKDFVALKVAGRATVELKSEVVIGGWETTVTGVREPK